ncbi:MAG: hypothetical protein ACRCXZ_02480, partial [Patescibacteria group bacterium]
GNFLESALPNYKVKDDLDFEVSGKKFTFFSVIASGFDPSPTKTEDVISNSLKSNSTSNIAEADEVVLSFCKTKKSCELRDEKLYLNFKK